MNVNGARHSRTLGNEGAFPTELRAFLVNEKEEELSLN